MSEQKRPPYWQIIRDAVQTLAGDTTNTAVRDWVIAKYPEAKPSTIACQIIACTVNHPSRIHYTENQKPRVAESQHDFLFRSESGRIEWFDARRHGKWAITKWEDGSLAVVRVDGEISDPYEVERVDRRPVATNPTFAAEAHLRDYLARHLEDIEEGLHLYVEGDERDGVEYNTREVGFIDLLALDREERFVVIELKVSDGPDSVCGQLLRYMGWVKRRLAAGKPVRGIIIAQAISKKIRYALADVTGVELREYELSLKLHPVPSLDA